MSTDPDRKGPAELAQGFVELLAGRADELAQLLGDQQVEEPERAVLGAVKQMPQ